MSNNTSNTRNTNNTKNTNKGQRIKNVLLCGILWAFVLYPGAISAARFAKVYSHAFARLSFDQGVFRGIRMTAIILFQYYSRDALHVALWFAVLIIAILLTIRTVHHWYDGYGGNVESTEEN